MDWSKAVAINKAVLIRIVAELVALLAAQGGALRLPLPVYRTIARILLPAESAVRRLIVMAARHVAVPPVAQRVMAPGQVIRRNGAKVPRPMTFRLFDTRKTFRPAESSAKRITGPRIRVFEVASPQALFLAKFAVRGLCTPAQTLRLGRRLDAVKRALDSLPRQAQRMARWQARRAAMESPRFRSPLRPGPPPGRRKRGREEIDKVLRECHALARHALSLDTS